VDSTIAAVFPAVMETMHAGYWKISSRAAINGRRYREISSSSAQRDLYRRICRNEPHQTT
jgi:hypothetical protein